MVQYALPARPPITRSTRSSPSQSGQLDRTVSGEFASELSMTGLPFPFDDHGALVEIVDAGLGVGNRGILVGPGKADFKLGKGDAVDDNGLEIRTPDPCVPKASSGLESLNLKTVVIHGASPAFLNVPNQTTGPSGRV